METVKSKITTNLVAAKVNNNQLSDLNPKSDSESEKSASLGAIGSLVSGILDGVTPLADSIGYSVYKTTQAKTGNYEPVVEEDHSTLWLTVGGVAIVAVIIILIIALKN